MARIRSDKPEAYQSETLAEISVAAERTFKGMATIADDRGRLADKPAQINGELWSMRGNHTREDLEAELGEMVKVDLVCRYTGCDGKRYLHMVTWDQHQKIDRPSKSRLPRCPHHQLAPDYCGLHEGECAPVDDSRQSREYSRGMQQAQTGHDGDARGLATPGEEASQGATASDAHSNGHHPPDQEKPPPSRQSREDSMQDRGSRTVDRGSRTRKPAPPDVGAEPPLPDMPDDPPESPGQRTNRLAKFFTELRPMSNFNATQTVIRKAVNANHSDAAIEVGLKKVVADGLALTAETLRQAIEGPAKTERSRRGGAADPLTDQKYGPGSTDI